MAETKPKRTPPRMLDVLEARHVTPRVRRLVLGGPGIRGLPPCWPGAHIKLFFARSHQSEPRLPTLDGGGRPVWPALPDRPVTRTYSVRSHDPAAGRLEVDFVLHEPVGPASYWAENAVVGDRVGMAGPGGPAPLLGPGDWYLLAGDHSAVPAMAAVLEALPASACGMAFLQVPGASELQELTAPPGVQLTWLLGCEKTADGRDLVDAVRDAEWLPGRPFVWAAGEGGQVVAIRDYARLTRGVSARDMYAVPYWKRRQTEEEYHQERHRVMDELAAERM